MLEELLALGHSGAEYDAWLIKIGDGDQFGSGFVAINPNSKIPALLDRSGPKPIRVFESGAILVYLAEKFGAFLPTERAPRAPNACPGCSGRWEARPISAAASAISTPTRRTRSNMPSTASPWRSKRQLDVLDRRLAESEYIAGGRLYDRRHGDLALVWRAGASSASRRRRVPVGAGLQECPALGRRDRRAARRSSAAAWSTAPAASHRASCTSATTPATSTRKRRTNSRREAERPLCAEPGASICPGSLGGKWVLPTTLNATRQRPARRTGRGPEKGAKPATACKSRATVYKRPHGRQKPGASRLRSASKICAPD